MYMYVMVVSIFIIGFSAIPLLMENLTSNYAHWKGQYQSPHSSDEGEAESTEVRSVEKKLHVYIPKTYHVDVYILYPL